MAWYGAAALDLDAFERFLQQQKIIASRVTAAPTAFLAAAKPVTVAAAAGLPSQAAASAQLTELSAAKSVAAGTRSSEVLIFSIEPESKLKAAAESTTAAASTADAAVAGAPALSRRGAALRKTFVVFSEGSIVGWNANWSDINAVWHMMRPAAADAGVANHVTESIRFGFAHPDAADAAHHNTIDGDSDSFVLASDDDRHKLPFSFALAQSVKVDVVEQTLAPVLGNVKKWQRSLSASGRLLCTVKQLRQTKTQLLSIDEDLNFKHSVQATPKLFWSAEHHDNRAVYKAAREYLELEERLEMLQNQIETVDESLTYLHEEVHVGTNEYLTWVIIWLIVFEIGLALDFHRIMWRLFAGSDGSGDVAQATATATTATGAAAEATTSR
jgi:uncharacterized Rmd1/YagE family protein